MTLRISPETSLCQSSGWQRRCWGAEGLVARQSYSPRHADHIISIRDCGEGSFLGSRRLREDVHFVQISHLPGSSFHKSLTILRLLSFPVLVSITACDPRKMSPKSPTSAQLISVHRGFLILISHI